ncbi:polyphosphate kinase 2 [Rhodanobacter sp. FW510-R12]|uniref:polyphosphate kinase 2 n=1 Tax=unclassified Rhodanobacter TaxID=2621553 RepID=UPI0007AA34F5|nr:MULTISPECIES: polyphosphate kinase 2 [unclassified Rhodanobacter]KZC16186.1 polyphosphate kinase 2 [Rhodanobacter sp. FW104-R8]KZC26687.1 polyphosphate kinase 2 [Rhodanobacter sp. FW510-T8]KZC30669.1 polyphosphate kinase 2 [Rhodanobacter sp. FW510-R10]
MDKRYRKALKELQFDLVRLQRGLRLGGKRLLVIFEGRDAAGKGGAIKAITESLDTRGYRIVALPKPSETEATQWYFQRYVAHLPSAGEFVLFDRSWYNRAVVEPAMGFCSEAQYQAFLDAVPAFEKLLVDDGLILIKYWLAVDQAEQEQRFAERAENPLKYWKLSPVDLVARRKYAEMGRLRDVMIERTHRNHAPWFVVDFNDQKRGRINLIRHLLQQLPVHEEAVDAVKLPKLKGRPGSEHVTDKALWVPDTF